MTENEQRYVDDRQRFWEGLAVSYPDPAKTKWNCASCAMMWRARSWATEAVKARDFERCPFCEARTTQYGGEAMAEGEFTDHPAYAKEKVLASHGLKLRGYIGYVGVRDKLYVAPLLVNSLSAEELAITLVAPVDQENDWCMWRRAGDIGLDPCQVDGCGKPSVYLVPRSAGRDTDGYCAKHFASHVLSEWD